MSSGPLSTLARVRYPVAPPPVRLKPASTRAPLGAGARAGLTRPVAGATHHPSSGPEDRNTTGTTLENAPQRSAITPATQPVELCAATIEAIATRVAELLAGRQAEPAPGSALIDAGELAQRTGVSRTWIYQHASELGAIRLGSGPNARLRFPPDAAERLSVSGLRPPVVTRVSKGRPRSAPPVDVPLLPIKNVRSAMSRCRFLRRRSH